MNHPNQTAMAEEIGAALLAGAEIRQVQDFSADIVFLEALGRWVVRHRTIQARTVRGEQKRYLWECVAARGLTGMGMTFREACEDWATKETNQAYGALRLVADMFEPAQDEQPVDYWKRRALSAERYVWREKPDGDFEITGEYARVTQHDTYSGGSPACLACTGRAEYKIGGYAKTLLWCHRTINGQPEGPPHVVRADGTWWEDIEEGEFDER